MAQDNVLSLLFLFVMVPLCIFAALTATNSIHSTNTAGCYYDENRTLHNCTYDNAAYAQQEAAYEQSGQILSFSSSLTWILAAFLVIAVIILASTLTKK